MQFNLQCFAYKNLIKEPDKLFYLLAAMFCIQESNQGTRQILREDEFYDGDSDSDPTWMIYSSNQGGGAGYRNVGYYCTWMNICCLLLVQNSVNPISFSRNLLHIEKNVRAFYYILKRM